MTRQVTTYICTRCGKEFGEGEYWKADRHEANCYYSPEYIKDDRGQLFVNDSDEVKITNIGMNYRPCTAVFFDEYLASRISDLRIEDDKWHTSESMSLVETHDISYDEGLEILQNEIKSIYDDWIDLCNEKIKEDKEE
ncbi:MAG: hypothetical protein WCS15_06325 [Prevotella sp.]